MPAQNFHFQFKPNKNLTQKNSEGHLQQTDIREHRHCMINHGVRGENEFSLSVSVPTTSLTDGENVDVVFRHQLSLDDKNSPYKINKIKRNQLENLRGYRQLFIDYFNESDVPENQKHYFKKGEVLVGIEAPHQYIPMCPPDYMCEKYRGYKDKRGKPTNGRLHGLNFKDRYWDVHASSSRDNPIFDENGNVSVDSFLQNLVCNNSGDCDSTICTRQSLEGLSLNYDIPIDKINEIWGDLTKQKNSRYTDNKYCQPRRICLRIPTGRNEVLEHKDSYCADGLKKMSSGHCIATDEIILNNIETYPDVSVDAEDNCKITWTEKYIENDQPKSNLIDTRFCTIPEINNLVDCESQGGTWTEVSVKYGTLARHMLGLEWLWSQADLDNVSEEKVQLFNKAEDYLLLSNDLHKLGKKLREY